MVAFGSDSSSVAVGARVGPLFRAKEWVRTSVITSCQGAGSTSGRPVEGEDDGDVGGDQVVEIHCRRFGYAPSPAQPSPTLTASMSGTVARAWSEPKGWWQQWCRAAAGALATRA